METRLSFLSTPGPCGYLPERTWQLQYEIVHRLTPDEYLRRLHEGWRRFGHAMFRPVCPACRACQSLRIVVDRFQPDRSQRRAWKANDGEVTVTIGPPVLTDGRRRLLRRFHAEGTESRGWPDQDDQQIEAFVANPFPTEEWTYRLDERLVGVGYVDRLRDGLSAIYFYNDPAERRRSLGTFNVLSIVAAAREAALPYVYLGYYVEGYRSLDYKRRFRPNEVLTGAGAWVPGA